MDTEIGVEDSCEDWLREPIYVSPTRPVYCIVEQESNTRSSLRGAISGGIASCWPSGGVLRSKLDGEEWCC